MTNSFYMPTRIVSGDGALDQLSAIVASLGLAAILVVSDQVISRQPWYAKALADLERSGARVSVFEHCAVDARVQQVDELCARVARDSIEGVIAIGGGSVMCAGKAVAIAAPNGVSIRECGRGDGVMRKSLPMVMVPTTAGSGSEVSQFTVLKDDSRHEKIVRGGPSSFPDVAILDPAVLASLPPGVSAQTGVDALTHALEAFTTRTSSALTDAISLEAIRLQAQALRESSGDASRLGTAKLLASAMANIACGNTRLGHAHALSLPLEGLFDLPHAIGVGVLMPRVLAFNLAVLPEKTFRLVEAFGGQPGKSLSHEDGIRFCVGRLEDLYRAIGFPSHWTEQQLAPRSIPKVARQAVPGLYAGPDAHQGRTPPSEDTAIVSAAARTMTVRQAEQIYSACLA